MERNSDPALRDDLTGMLNRRYLREFFASEWRTVLEESGSVALLLLDLDLFKEVNDRHGHLVGDEVLRQTAQRLGHHFRANDLLIRYGGDEFVVVLPGAGAGEALQLAERIRRALVDDEWLDPGTGEAIGLPISFSIGAAAAPADGEQGDQILAAADRRLYDDKRLRRDRRGRKRAVAVAAVAVLAAGTIGWLGWRATRVPTSPPQVGAESTVVSTPAGNGAGERSAAEVRALRAEVERLQGELAEGRTSEETSRFQARIRELEATLEEVSRQSDATPVALVAQAGAEDETADPGPAPAAAPGEPTVQSTPGSRSFRVPAAPPAVTGASAGARAGAVQDARIQAPVLLRHELPEYPLIARRRRVSGAVEFRVWVDSRGRVEAVAQTSPPLGFGLDDAARKAALSAAYRPARRAGMSVDGETTLTIRFVLDD